MSVTNTQTVVASGDVVKCTLGDGLALLDLRANQYYSLNKVGAFIWETIQTPRSVDDILAKVVRRFEVTPDQCRQDVDALLSSLKAAGLVRVQDAVPASADVEEGLSAAMSPDRRGHEDRPERS